MDQLESARTRWAFSGERLIAETATSRVFRVDRGGEATALKLLKPYGADEIAGAGLMAWYDGVGSARILGVQSDMILMEWLDGEALGDLTRNGRDDDATAILCDVAAALHQVRPNTPEGLDPLPRRFGPLLSTDMKSWQPRHHAGLRRAMDLAQHLIGTTRDAMPLHGDLHHDNVVHSRRGWLAIDAKGVLGDAAYDFANAFRNPAGAEAVARRPERIEHLASQFSARLGLDRRRILGWAAAHCALSACWDREAGTPGKWNFVLLPLVLAALEAA